jgi:hypothetical protein
LGFNTACREVGVRRDGRNMVDTGRARHYPPIAAPPVVISGALRLAKECSPRRQGPGKLEKRLSEVLGETACAGTRFGMSSVSSRRVELGDEFPVGGAFGGEVLIAFVEL